VLRFLFLKSDN